MNCDLFVFIHKTLYWLLSCVCIVMLCYMGIADHISFIAWPSEIRKKVTFSLHQLSKFELNNYKRTKKINRDLASALFFCVFHTYCWVQMCFVIQNLKWISVFVANNEVICFIILQKDRQVNIKIMAKLVDGIYLL